MLDWLSLRAMSRRAIPTSPLLILAILLIMDFSVGAAAMIPVDSIIENDTDNETEPDSRLPPAMRCGEVICAPIDRSPGFPSWDAGSPVEDVNWWFNYWYDLDSDGMDDRLQRIITGDTESVSLSQITGEDGRKTVAIVIDYSWHAGQSDEEALMAILADHGWHREGSWFFPMEILDSIVVDHVPISALIEIWQLNGVVMVEQQNVIIPFLSEATRGSKVRDSSIYDETMRDFGYDGSGVVIAVIDSGVDNEHFSLDDFSDDNTDNTNEPNDLADPKWLGGCDATSWNTDDCNDGTYDPDDGAGHGTHVAGIALGTGDSRRINQGYAPGAYLVDVKVMTDAGGGNSGQILRGLEWVVQNVNTDWGNNDSSRGIDVMTMSFGSAGSVTGEDPGDNGTNAEARAVNQAAEAGIVPIAAIGNDGYRRVTSVGAADSAITVGSIEDKNTIIRDDDEIASYSNSGPREDDGDDNQWDELKPDVVSPGSSMMSAQHAASASPIPGQGSSDLADDDYVNMDGTSMACPAVAGLVAVILEIDEDLSPQEVKDLLRNNSEMRGSASKPEITDKWNDKYGFGIVDGNLLLQELIGDGGGGGGNNSTEPPPPTGAGDWAVFENPTGDWVIEGEVYNIRGHITDAAEENGSTEEVHLRVTYKYRPSDGGPLSNSVLVDWHKTYGKVNWSTPINLPNFADDDIEAESITIEVKVKNEFDQWSNTTKRTYLVGRVTITLNAPSGQSAVSGDVQVHGTLETVNGAQIQWRIGTDPWENITNYWGNSAEEMDWSHIWDTTTLPDGIHRFSVRFVSGVGVISEEIRTTVEIDNNPPSADLMFRSGLSVQEFGVPISESYVNTFLEVKTQIRNIGDISAEDFKIYLLEDGARKDEVLVQYIGSGDIMEISLSWNPATVGDKLITISLDPSFQINETDETDNDLSITFPVLARPQGIDLVFREGAIRTEPSIPRPNEQFLITARIDNLGSTDATSVEATLEFNTEHGWEAVQSTTISLVVGQGASQIAFAHIVTESGPIEMRVSVQGEGLADLNWENNEIEGTILVDESTLSGIRETTFSYGENPIEIIELGEEGLVISEKDGGLALYRINSNRALTACTNLLEEMWTGDLSTWSTDDGIAHIAWTRRYIDNDGYFQQTVSYSTIDATCTMTPIQDLMEPILLSDGKYFGIDIDKQGDELLVAGYHRDITTGGTFQDQTSIFLLSADAPTKSSDWRYTPNVIGEIEISSSVADPLVIEFGEEGAHLLYQSVRNDTTGIDRLGLWYAHGDERQSSWAYKKTVGDEAGSQKMIVNLIDGEDHLTVVWREGVPAEAELIAKIVDSTFMPIENNSLQIPARGLNSIVLIETYRGAQLFYDFVGPSGTQIQYGIINAEEGWIGLSNRITTSKTHLGAADRSPGSDEVIILSWHETSGWQIRALIDDWDLNNENTPISEQLRIALGLDEQNFKILAAGVAIAILLLSTLVLLMLSIRAIRYLGKRRGRVVTATVMLEEDVVDVIEETDITVKSSEVELVEPELTEGASERKKRRETRSHTTIIADSLPDMPVPALPVMPTSGTSPIPGMPALPAMNQPVICNECNGRFEVGSNLKMVKCPICDERIDL
jgi:subtilisin family serine protease